MVVERKPGCHARLADCAEEATRHFLTRLGLGMNEVDLLVPAPAAPDFADDLRARLGIPADWFAFTGETWKAFTRPRPSPPWRRHLGPVSSSTARVKKAVRTRLKEI